ncbi:MAG: biopolymer transporter ExbD [Gammaproteobacteria bacterium]|nr:biopolymer transporter ExbD [Gammaproteobacteria bacterium]
MAFGQLNQGGSQQPMHEINVTPLVDVMLVLLVLFIVTAPLLTSQIKVNLPDAKTESVQVLKTIILSITASGKIYLDDQVVDESQLLTKMNELKQSRPDAPVELRADGEIAYKKVAQVMAVLQNAGISKIIFVTKQG